MKARLLALALCLAPLSAAAQTLSVGQISAYLNSIRTAQAPFVQIHSDGTTITGVLSLHRPGRARFDYDADDSLVIAGGGQVAIFDPVSNRRPEQYPLRRTPLAHVLARTVDLGQSGALVDHWSDGTITSITLQDPKEPELGTIELFFTSDPVALTAWVITNEMGERTTVQLGALDTSISLSARLFSIPQEIIARGLN